MHTLAGRGQRAIGHLDAVAAWNAAIYVAQIEDVRLSEVVRDGRYLEATDRVLEATVAAVVQRRNLCDLAPSRAGMIGRWL